MKHPRISCFEPKALRMLQEVFRASWEMVQDTAPAQATREILARRIMSHAADGETDPQKLMVFALKGIQMNPPLLNFFEWTRFGSPSHKLDIRMSRNEGDVPPPASHADD